MGTSLIIPFVIVFENPAIGISIGTGAGVSIGVAIGLLSPKRKQGEIKRNRDERI
ncbi:MAG: hypothetical protein JKY02_05630 [Flavobacteriaceae bacterium]|nr:hypothetical protein [Flavobacteriaceae bacterium]